MEGPSEPRQKEHKKGKGGGQRERRQKALHKKGK